MDRSIPLCCALVEVRLSFLPPMSGIQAADHLDGRVHYPFQRLWLDNLYGVAGGVVNATNSPVIKEQCLDPLVRGSRHSLVATAGDSRSLM